MKKKVTLIHGDGIGPEIVEAVKEIFAAANAPVEWENVYLLSQQFFLPVFLPY